MARITVKTQHGDAQLEATAIQGWFPGPDPKIVTVICAGQLIPGVKTPTETENTALLTPEA